MTKPAKQTPPLMICARRVETVEPEPVDQKMWHFPAGRLISHVPVELFIDKFKFLPRQHRRIFIVFSNTFIIKQEFSPVVRTD